MEGGEDREGRERRFLPSVSRGCTWCTPRDDTAHSARLGGRTLPQRGCDQTRRLSAHMQTQQSHSPLQQSCMCFPFCGQNPSLCLRPVAEQRSRAAAALVAGASLLGGSLSKPPGLLT